jgi:hypothetical protein
VDPKALRLARRLRARADEAERAARAAEDAAGIDRQGLAVARGKTAGGSAPAHQAITAALLTVTQAAALCGTTPQVLTKAWAPGSQLRPARPEWRRTLARFGIPRDVWPDRA